MAFLDSVLKEYDTRLISYRSNSCIACDNENIRRPVRKQADRNDARNLVDPGFHLKRVTDLKVVDIQNVISVIGNKVFPPDRLAAHFDHLPGDK